MADSHDQGRLIESTMGSGSGTFLKLVKMPTIEDYPNECFMVMYLRPNKLFLFLGYWHGYERSVVAGKWRREDGIIYLDGLGDVRMDTGTSIGRRFERTLTVDRSEWSLHLNASESLSRWSLLGYKGNYSYVGCETIIVDPHGTWLPKSLEEVDSRISAYLGSR